MSKFWDLVWFSSIYLVFLVPLNVAEDVCTKRSSCVCVFPSGMGVDLTPTVKTQLYEAPYNRLQFNKTHTLVYTYYYHPCIDVIPNLNITINTNTQSCGQPLSMARITNIFSLNETIPGNKTYILGDELCEKLGTSEDSTFTNNYGMSIVYKNVKLNNTVILFCTKEEEDRLVVYDASDPDNIVLAFFTKHACLQQLEAPGRSLGSTLLIVFFCLVIFYLVLGVCTKKFLMGATGIEVIPNLGFWTDLPNLVKDGWAFAINGFKLPARSNQMSSPDPNSYDSI